MLCDECGKNEATVNITLAAPTGAVTRHLCAECAAEMQQKLMAGRIAEILKHIVPFQTQPDTPVSEPFCPSCGLKWKEFENTGRLGCSECYRAFRENLRGIMHTVHGYEMPVDEGNDTVPELSAELEQMISGHSGQYAKSALEQDDLLPVLEPGQEDPRYRSDPDGIPQGLKRMAELTEQIHTAVKQEQFEEAARLQAERRSLMEGMKISAVR